MYHKKPVVRNRYVAFNLFLLKFIRDFKFQMVSMAKKW